MGHPLVLPDGTLFGEGVKVPIKEKLLEECNLHTVVRLPKGVFNPYTSIKTNLLFFTKGEPTKNVRFYEHPLPEGQNNYSKSKPLQIKDFAPEKKWWGKRKENDFAWSVSIEDIKATEEIAAAWKRVATNFGILFERVESVEGARTAILSLAIRGDLLGEHRTWGAAQGDLPLLPAGWSWKRVDEVADVKLGKMRSPESHSGAHMRPYLRVANVLEGRIDEVVKFELRPNDILLNEGQSIELVGRPAIYRGEVPGACFQKNPGSRSGL